MKKAKSSVSAPSESSENSSEQNNYNSYCIFMHVVEGINFQLREVREGSESARMREKVIMNASLNGIQFEVEGTNLAGSETTVLNSNCVWECDLLGIKRLKTDNRPVKLVFYIGSPNAERKVIGNLLLPLRGLPIVNSASGVKVKMFWHKLSCLSNEWRTAKPEVYLMLTIVKKKLLNTGELEALSSLNKKSARSTALQSPERSVTACMLQSQSNIYVQQLVQLGLLQVGNDAQVDCDIIEVVLVLRELKSVNKLLKSLAVREPTLPLVIVLDFVGNVTSIDLAYNDKDSYVLNEKLGLRFKTSLRMLRMYFQRVFYLPINMLYNGTAIANFRMDFGKLMPADSYFQAGTSKYCFDGSFVFDRLCKSSSARDVKPAVEYTFSIDIKVVNSRPLPSTSNELSQGTPNASANESTGIAPSRRNTPRMTAQKLSALHMKTVELMQPGEKVAQWCREVIKARQQGSAIDVGEAPMSVLERALAWPPISGPLPHRPADDTQSNVDADSENREIWKKKSKSSIRKGVAELKPRIELVEIGVNTDASKTGGSVDDANNLHEEVAKELEEWKLLEMATFQLELKRKELLYMKGVEEELAVRRATERSPNIVNCAALEEKLDEIHRSISDRTLNTQREHEQRLEEVTRELKENYQSRFDDLELHITRLKSEMQEQLQEFHYKHMEMQSENTQLAKEKQQLMQQLHDMDEQLSQLKKQDSIDAVDLRKALNELCLQTERYAQMEKSKDFYKGQWQRCTRRVHKLKLSLMTKRANEAMEHTEPELDFNIRDVISGVPQPTLQPECSFTATSTSSTSSSMEYMPDFNDGTHSDSA